MSAHYSNSFPWTLENRLVHPGAHCADSPSVDPSRATHSAVGPPHISDPHVVSFGHWSSVLQVPPIAEDAFAVQRPPRQLSIHQRRSVSVGRVVCGREHVVSANSTHSRQRSPQRTRDRVEGYKEPPGPHKLQSNMPSHSRKGKWDCIDRCSCWCMLRPGRYNLKRRIPSCANTSILLRHRY